MAKLAGFIVGRLKTEVVAVADPKEMWRRFVDLRNGKDISALVGLYADDGVLEFPGRGQIRGREALTTFYQGNFAAHPDAKMTLVTQAVSGAAYWWLQRRSGRV